MHNKVPFTKFNQDSTGRRTPENNMMVMMMMMMTTTMMMMMMMTMMMMMKGKVATKVFSSRLSRQTVRAHLSCIVQPVNDKYMCV